MSETNRASSLPVQPTAAVEPAHPGISTVMVRALIEVVQQRGVAPEQLLGNASGALQEPADRAFFPRAYFQELLTRALDLTGDPALGLHCGFDASSTSFGLMAPLVGHSPTLRRALELVIQFQPLMIDGLRVELSERMGVARLRCSLSSQDAANRSLAEMIVAGLVRTLLSFGCARHEISSVSFEHARPAYYPAYTRAFAGAERFAQAYTGVEFATQALDRSNLHHHSELHTLMLAEAEQKLKRIWKPRSYTERVRSLMSSRSVSELPDMVLAARELGLSVRSLRRHLEDEGTSFRELTQVALHDAACSMLRNPAVTLQSIAHTLGFSDPSAFHRAFRRWSQLTPSEYRDQFLASERGAETRVG